jgi:hypothetical protein
MILRNTLCECSIMSAVSVAFLILGGSRNGGGHNAVSIYFQYLNYALIATLVGYGRRNGDVLPDICHG